MAFANEHTSDPPFTRGVHHIAGAEVPARLPRMTDASLTIVLVHGAFAESVSWNGVIPDLPAGGFPVVAAANPLWGVAGTRPTSPAS